MTNYFLHLLSSHPKYSFMRHRLEHFNMHHNPKNYIMRGGDLLYGDMTNKEIKDLERRDEGVGDGYYTKKEVNAYQRRQDGTGGYPDDHRARLQARRGDGIHRRPKPLTFKM